MGLGVNEMRQGHQQEENNEVRTAEESPDRSGSILVLPGIPAMHQMGFGFGYQSSHEGHADERRRRISPEDPSPMILEEEAGDEGAEGYPDIDSEIQEAEGLPPVLDGRDIGHQSLAGRPCGTEEKLAGDQGIRQPVRLRSKTADQEDECAQ